MTDEWHVLPLDDLKEHKETRDCWCKPTVEVEESRFVIVHNALDRRELYENSTH